MYSFKSSPLIQECPNRPKRGSKRAPTLHMKQPEYKIANPFRTGQQQNFLPEPLKQQIQQMQYISPTAITKINFPNTMQSQRRSSNFNRHLSMMQNAARQQQEKFKGLMTTTKTQKKREEEHYQMIHQQMPMSISQMDNLSIDMENCLNQMNYRDVDQEFGIFDEIYQPNPSEIIFYSQTDIIQPQVNNDFSCYFNN